MAVRSTCIQVGGAFRSPRPQVRQFRPFQLSQLRHFDFLRLSPENSTTYAREEMAWILPVFLARHEAILEVSVPNKVKNYARSTRERSNSSGRTGDPDNRPQLKPRKEHEKAGQGHCEIAEELSTENRSRSHDGLRKENNIPDGILQVNCRVFRQIQELPKRNNCNAIGPLGGGDQ